MVQFVDGCIYRCSGHRKLPHLDVPATLKYFHLLHCPNSYVELFILALQKGRPPDKLDNTNARSQTRVSSVGDTHQGKLLHILHGSTFLISSTRWLSGCFSPPFHIPHTGTCLPLDQDWPSHHQHATTLNWPLQKSRLTDLCCCLTPRYPQQTVGNLAFRVRLVFSAMFTQVVYYCDTGGSSEETEWELLLQHAPCCHLVTPQHQEWDLSLACSGKVRFRRWLKRRTATAVQIQDEGKVHYYNERDAFAWRLCLWQA